MKIIRLMLRQTVDIALLLISLVLFIVYLVNPDNNFTGFLLILCGYILFNIYNKAVIIIKSEIKE